MGAAADEAALRKAFETARSRAERFFGSRRPPANGVDVPLGSFYAAPCALDSVDG